MGSRDGDVSRVTLHVGTRVGGGDASRVWTAGGRGLDLSMRWEWEMVPLERISLYTELARFARSLIYRARVCTRDL